MHKDVDAAYRIFISLMLRSEGALCGSLSVYNQDKFLGSKRGSCSTPFSFPISLLPLLYSAASLLQISLNFFPFYLKQQSEYYINDPVAVKIMQDTVWFQEKIYPELVKIFYNNNLRVQPCQDCDFEFSKHAPLSNNNIFFFDSHETHHYPCSGYDLQDAALTYDDMKDKNIFLLGNISDVIKNKSVLLGLNNTISGISPVNNQTKPVLQQIMHYAAFFSKTIFASTVNLHIPLILHHLQAGLSPISFYYALYHSENPQWVLQNALCLFHLKPLLHPVENYVYHQSHISTPINNNLAQNYLFLLSDIA